MTRSLPVCLMFLLWASPAFAFEGENLLVAVPPGYKIDYRQKQGDKQITEMVPAAESVQGWTEMVTVQIFNGMKGVTPDQVHDRLQQAWTGSCGNAVAGPVAHAVENGYPIAFWMMFCPLNKDSGKPETTWFKAIQGNDSVYLVQKAFKFEPSKEQVVQWTRYLKQVAVCDTRLKDRACPRGIR